MSFFDAENIRTVCGGTWFAAPKNSFSVTGVGTDTRENLSDRAFIALRGENHDGHDHLDSAIEAGASLLIVDEPRAASQCSIPTLKVSNTRAALRDLAAAYRATLNKTKVIAVTGSCGKTTTKELIHSTLASSLRGSRAPRSFNNDVGVPLTCPSTTTSACR